VTFQLPGCILFDQDGTLLDSLPGIEFSIRAAFRACQLPEPLENLRKLIGPPIRSILARVGHIDEPGRLDALEQAFRDSYDSEGWQQTLCFPDASPVVRTLHGSGRRLFVISNKPRHISVQILKRVRLLDHFEDIVTRDSRQPPWQDKPAMIEFLLADRKISRDNCVMVGDTMEDASAAAATGVRFICMAHGYGAALPASVPVACTLDGFLQFLPLMQKEFRS
jgi:phosphoglycolate phosphatase